MYGIGIKRALPRDEAIVELIRELAVYQEAPYPRQCNHLDDIDVLDAANVFLAAAYLEGDAPGIRVHTPGTTGDGNSPAQGYRVFEPHGYVRRRSFGVYGDDPLSVFMGKVF